MEEQNLIEFCCPACSASLAVDVKVAGGQVNCPKCSKLIFIPMRPPLARVDDREPFSEGIKRDSHEIIDAIAVCVEPYRIEVESKTKLLNDAVEMVKIRNQRIRDVETLMLGVQKELWALEVEHDERTQAFKRAHAERKKLKEIVGKDGVADLQEAREAEIDPEQVAHDQRMLDEYGSRVKELEEKLSTHTAKLDVLEAERDQAVEEVERLKGQQQNLEESLSLRNEQLSEASRNLSVLPILSEFSETVLGDYERQEVLVASRNDVLDEARSLLETAGGVINQAEQQIRSQQSRITELEQEQQAQAQQTVNLKEAFEERERMLKEQQSLLEEQASQFESVKGGKDASDKELQALHGKLTQMQKDLLAKEDRVQDALAEQQQHLERAIGLEKKKSELESMMEAETQRADAAMRKIESLQQTLDDQENVNRVNTNAYEQERDTLMARLEDVTAKEAKTAEQLDGLRKEMEQMRKNLAAQPDAMETVSHAGGRGGDSQLETLLEASQAELVELRSQYRALEDKAKAQQNRQAHDKTLMERLRKVEAENREGQKQRMELESELTEANRKVAKLSVEVEAAQVSGGSGADAEDAGERSVADLLRELNEVKAELEEFGDVKWQLERKVKEMTTENNRLNSTVKTLSANLKAQWKRGATTR